MHGLSRVTWNSVAAAWTGPGWSIIMRDGVPEPIQDQEVESAVLLRALEVFGDSGRTLKWMRETNPALNGDTPIHAIQSEQGREEVLNILGRIEYGVIS